ncbi:toll-like receptor 6 [Colletes gigas]|uniref:toll-like receptor 6 n=1 Tax=Colletes gigas TaxID=935657 RepID=UPI001C9B5198|nr:toll-like receptor 6 [Colletes gigas]
MITRYLLIFSIAIPGLVARTVSWDTKYADVEIDQKTVYKQDIIRCLDDESVRLSGLNFIEIPNHIVKSDAIKAISLDDNNIVKLPANVFDEVPNLQCLNLAKNNIPYERLFGFRHNKLKTLIFDDNPNRGQTMFSNFEPIRYSTPPAGTYFPNLESLSLNNVYFENFPSHFNESFPRLSTLYITDNGLQFLDDNIFSILPSNLKGLHLERNNFTSLILRDAGNIEELYFDGNPLVSFEIGPGSSTIKLISLANCTLNSRDQFQIQAPLLTTLDLSYNRLTTIPFQSIPQFLEKLSLSHNEFTSVPNLGYLQKLHSLSLSHNIIEYINDEIMQLLPESLQKLSLRGNRINSIDDMAFSTFSMLEELDLSKNKLRSLPAVWAKNLKMLRHLNLKSNFFATIADMSISSLISLRALYIEENMVTFIDENSLQLVPKLCTVYVR